MNKGAPCNTTCESARDRRCFLRVKLKSLAAEAVIIRQEEARTPKLRWFLSDHRRGVVRNAARHTLLAYSFLRGRSYKQLEHKCHQPPDWNEVAKMVAKYGIQFQGGDQSWNDYKKALEEQADRLKKWPESL